MKYRILIIAGLLWIAMISLLISSAYAWSYPANFKFATNVMVNSFNGVIFNNKINNTAWFLFSTASNVLLSNTSITQMDIAGYDKNGTFIGVIDAFPYPLGSNILIQNVTTTGASYNTISIFFGEIVPQNTYLSTFVNTNVKRYPAIPFVAAPVSVTVYTQPIPILFGKCTLCNFNMTTNFTNVQTGNFIGIMHLYFNLNNGYVFFANNNKDRNVSLRNVPVNIGFYSYLFTAKNLGTLLADNNSNQGFLGYQSLYQANTNSIFWYMNPNQSHVDTFLSENTGVFGTTVGSVRGSKVFNSFVTQSAQTGVFFQPRYNNQNYQYHILVNFTNTIGDYFNTVTDYSLMPAYSSNYTVLGSNQIANPIAPVINNTCGSGQNTVNGWYYFYNNRVLFNVTNWNYTFTTNGFFHNPANVVNVTTHSVGYLLLNLTHFTGMGNSCQDIYFRAWNNATQTDLGSIPFTTLQCNATSSKASFILSNRTSSNAVYKSGYAYFAGRNGQTSFSNPATLSNWQQNYGSGTTVTTNAINEEVRFNTGFVFANTMQADGIGNSYVEVFNAIAGNKKLQITGSPSGTTNGVITGNAQKSLLTGVTGSDLTSYIKYGGDFPNSGGQNDTIFTRGLYLFHQEINTYSVSNGISSVSTTGNGATGYYSPIIINLVSPNTARVRVFYSNNFTQGNTDTYVSNCNSTNGGTVGVTTTIPVTNNTFITNSMVSGISTNTVAMNHTLVTLGLTSNVSLISIQIPKYALFIMLLILTIIILSMGHEIPTMIGLSFIWIVGIFNVQILVVGIFVVIIYGSYVFVEKHKQVK